MTSILDQQSLFISRNEAKELGLTCSLHDFDYSAGAFDRMRYTRPHRDLLTEPTPETSARRDENGQVAA